MKGRLRISASTAGITPQARHCCQRVGKYGPPPERKTKHLANSHSTLDFYEDEFVFFIGTNLLFPDRDDSAIDVRDFAKIQKELLPIPASTASATAASTFQTLEQGMNDISVQLGKTNTGST